MISWPRVSYVFVVTAPDGEVTFAGWEAGAGNVVKMRHKNAYQTAYLHLSGFGPGVRRGAVLRAMEETLRSWLLYRDEVALMCGVQTDGRPLNGAVA